MRTSVRRRWFAGFNRERDASAPLVGAGKEARSTFWTATIWVSSTPGGDNPLWIQCHSPWVAPLGPSVFNGTLYYSGITTLPEPLNEKRPDRRRLPSPRLLISLLFGWHPKRLCQRNC